MNELTDPEKAVVPTDEQKESKICKTRQKYLLIGVSTLATVTLIVGLSLGLPRMAITARKQNDGVSPEIQDGNDPDDKKSGVSGVSESSPSVIAAARSSFLPFNDVKLPDFDSNALLGYTENVDGTCGQLRSDLEDAVKQYANVEIMDQSRYIIYNNDDDFYNDDVHSPLFEMAEGVEPMVALNNKEALNQPTSQQDYSAEAGGESSYGTNNQVAGVDEADKVKSDGTYVYTAYGDILIIWNAVSGEEVGRVTMPPRIEIDGDDYFDDGFLYYPENFEDTIINVSDVVPAMPDVLVVDEGSRFGGRSLRKSLNAGKVKSSISKRRTQRRTNERTPKKRASQFWGYNPKPSIEDILLDPESNRLGLIVSGYGTDNSYSYSYFDSESDFGALTGVNATQFRLYDTSLLSGGGSVELLGTFFLRGNHENARSIGSSAYIVTMSAVSMYSLMGRHLNRWDYKEEEKTNSTTYISAATEIARARLDLVVSALFNDITEITPDGTVDCSSVVRVAQFSSGSEGESVEDFNVGSNHLLSNFAQVHGIDMSASTEGLEDLSFSTSAGTFLPSAYDTNIYASSSMLFIATQGYQYDSESSLFDENTFILGFSLDSSTSLAVAKNFGQVPGYLLNQYAMDHHKYESGDYLRVATTNSAQWGIDPDDTFDGFRSWRQISQASNQLYVLELGSLQDGVSVMTKTGSIEADLGLPNETITAVRFLGDIGFAVTFEKTDPFYTFNLKDPSEPKIVGELKVSGYSSYLYPIITATSQHILAVGEEADEKGRALGFQISLFDVTQLEDPQLLSRYVVENSRNEYSSSESLYDYHAFRYLTESKKLIIPLEIRDLSYFDNEEGNAFDGFVVYDIDEDKGIVPSLDISHIEARNMITKNSCWYSARLPSRSLVFNGKLTTIKGHTVVSTSLSSGDELWTYDVDENLANEDNGRDICFGWWW